VAISWFVPAFTMYGIMINFPITLICLAFYLFLYVYIYTLPRKSLDIQRAILKPYRHAIRRNYYLVKRAKQRNRHSSLINLSPAPQPFAHSSQISIPMQYCDPSWLHDYKRHRNNHTTHPSYPSYYYLEGVGYYVEHRHGYFGALLRLLTTSSRLVVHNCLDYLLQMLKPIGIIFTFGYPFSLPYQLDFSFPRIFQKIFSFKFFSSSVNFEYLFNRMTASSCMCTALFSVLTAQARQGEKPLTFDSDASEIFVDNCTSGTLTPHRSDFITYETIPQRAILGVGGPVPGAIGQGTIQYEVTDDNGRLHTWEIDDVKHVPTSPARLFCPQQFARQRLAKYNDLIAHCDTKAHHIIIEWSEGETTTCPKEPFKLTIPLNHENVGTIIINKGFRCFHALVRAFPQFDLRSGYVSDDEDTTSSSQLFTPSPGTPDTINHSLTTTPPTPSSPAIRSTPLKIPFLDSATTIPPDTSIDPDILTKEDLSLFMEYHERLGHLSFDQLKQMALNGVIPRKLAKCVKPKCPGCLYAKQHRTPWKAKGNRGRIRLATKPGEVVSVDQLESRVPGFIPQRKGILTKRRFCGATVFVDHFSDLTYIHLMEKLSSEETVQAKVAFETYAKQLGVTILHYHYDNGRFADKTFQDHVKSSNQTQSFCGVGVHHQNGKVENRIRYTTEGARAALLHAQHRWPQAIDGSLWPQALMNHNNVRNQLPGIGNTKCPLAKFSGTNVDANLKHFHPFGCPVYVLQAPLQSPGGKFPKWQERSRVGIFLCHSPHHASSVPLILNTQTGLVSPQFHCVYDDRFETPKHDAKFKSHWQQRANLQTITQSTNLVEDNMSTPGPLADYRTTPIPPALQVPWEINDTSSEHSVSTNSSNIPESEGAVTIEESSTPNDPLLQQEIPNIPDIPDVQPLPTEHTPPQQTTRSGRQVNIPSRFRDSVLYMFAFTSCDSTLRDKLYLSGEFHPLAMLTTYVTAFVSTSDPDTMTLDQALKEPDKQEFIKAMKKELADHTNRRHWKVVSSTSLPPGTKPLMMVWSMKRKRDPAGEIIKWKARLCVHGGQSIKGIHYWDTYSPVVSWSTVRLVLILALIHGWAMRSVDFVLAFPQADVKTDIYLKLPKYCHIPGLSHKSNRNYMKLIKNVYGLCDASKTWFDKLTEGLIQRGFKPSAIDPCLFTKGSLMMLVYVDDCIIIHPDTTKIDSIIHSLKLDFDLTDEGDIKDYLGVRINKNKDGSVEMIQPKMIERCLAIVGIPINDPTTTKHDTPSVANKILHRDKKGPLRRQKWNYRAAIGALLYVAAMTRPDIAYSVHQCARFSANPKRSHEEAVKRICRYLLATKDKGLILRPNFNKGFECYADADFAGNWCPEDCDDLASAISRSGYLITFAGCPIVWGSKMQTLVALSTTEAEIISLSTATREVITLMNLLNEFKDRGFPIKFSQPVIKCRVFEDNAAAIEIANNPKLRPRTKHLGIRIHHFRDFVMKKLITIEYIKSKEQLADALTKALPRDQFRYLISQIMGW